MIEEMQEGHTLVLDGAVTIRTIAAVHEALSDLMARHSAIEIDCAAVIEADLTLIQLLLAARHSAAASGKTVTLTHPASGALLDALSRGGLIGPMAGGTENDDAFWLKGATSP